MNHSKDGSDGASPSPAHSLPQRKHPAHGIIEDTSKPTIVFVTVCTKNRKPWLAKEEVHQLLRKTWSRSESWLVGRYAVMPDHLHLFTAPTDNAHPLESWVRFWKTQISRRLKNSGCEWQTDHWDRRLRNDESYADKWDYVRHNPVRHGLVRSAAEWPFQGELNALRWD